jgi:MATE family multidrug resistance protein
MIVMLAGVGLNALGNWVLIYGHLGVPALGLTGAGISTLISRSLSTLFIFLLLRFDPMMREAWPLRWLAPFSGPRLRRMLAVGLPAAGGLLFETGAFAAATVMMGWLGAVPLAAHQIAITCAAMTFMFALGISMAVGIRMSSAVGSGDHATLRSIWQGGALMGLVVSLSLACVFFFFGHTIAAFFVRDPEVISVASGLLFVASLFQIFDSAQVINAAALRGLTDVKVPAVLTFVAYWLIALPLGYFLAIRGPFGPAGIWWALAAGLAAAAVMLGIRVVRMTHKDMVHHA